MKNTHTKKNNKNKKKHKHTNQSTQTKQQTALRKQIKTHLNNTHKYWREVNPVNVPVAMDVIWLLYKYLHMDSEWGNDEHTSAE